MFIGAGVEVVRLMGVLLLGLGMVAGQLVGSLLFDLFVASAPYPLGWVTVIGVMLTLVAAGVAAWHARSAKMAG